MKDKASGALYNKPPKVAKMATFSSDEYSLCMVEDKTPLLYKVVPLVQSKSAV